MATKISRPGDTITFGGKVLATNNYEQDIKVSVQLDDGQIIEIPIDSILSSSPPKAIPVVSAHQAAPEETP